MRITVGCDHDLAVTPGTTVPEIAKAARNLGINLGPNVWCGNVALDPRHPAGTWPLLEGARLTSEPGPPCAPSRGPTLLVVAGPHAGGRASIGTAGVLIGREDGADLLLKDPAISRAHAMVKAGTSLVATDLGSSNGTIRWRGSEARAIGRPQEAKDGDVLAIGSSLIAILDDAAEPVDKMGSSLDTPTRGTDLSARLAPLAGSIVSGIMVAAMTGRWYLAILGLAYPAYILGSIGVARLRPAHVPWDLSVLPSTLPFSRRSWLAASPRSIAIIGDARHARAFARALVLMLGRKPRADGWEEPWMRWLPGWGPTDPEVILIAEEPAPSWCDATAVVGPDGCLLWLNGRATPLPPVSIAESEADALARALAGETGTSSLPRRVRWADVAESLPSGPDGTRTLTVPLGATLAGPFILDLDAQGPHLLIAGTTGSGKSALLETLILGLALRYPPDDLGIALIDFKGGAGVRVCADLPHVRGVLTDLDPHLARRALGALAMEIEDRKTALTQVGLSSFREWEATGGAPPRLLVVADEYQELAAQYREFLPDLARLAAQGRSLGLHLVLATQRPAGAVTPEIRANVGTTFALRVVTDAESRDLVGTSDAAEFPVDVPGRAIAVTGTGRSVLQVALPCVTPTPRIRPWGEKDALAEASRDMASYAARRWVDHEKAAPLWLDPLPGDLGEEIDREIFSKRMGEHPGLWLGRGDLPAERHQPEIAWDPRSGPLLIAGPPRSGRTTALRLLAFGAHHHGLRPVWLPLDPREAARTIALLPHTPEALLLVDDAQRALSSLADVDRGAPVDNLIGLAASGAPLAFVLPKGGTHRLSTHAVAHLIFASGDPVEDAAWSMPRELHGLVPLPGRARFGATGRWCECQVGRVSVLTNEPLVTPLPSSIPFDRLPQEGGLVIGLGGDDATWVVIDPASPILVVGPPGTAREAVESSLSGAAELHGTVLNIQTLESLLTVSRSLQSPATIVLSEPTERTAREFYRGDLDGLIDPRPPMRRVLVVIDGTAKAAQLADPRRG